MEQIGVRELRQHASKYLARVERGETFEVTDRGRPVALLVPKPAGTWEQMIASGRVLPATDPGDITDAPPQDWGIDASTELAKLRDEGW